MSKIRVALDTSALRRDPTLSGAAFEALARFAEEGYVDLLIPKVAADEFGTLPSPKLDALATRRKTVKELRKNTPDELYEKIAHFEDTVANEFSKLEAGAKLSFDAWIARTHAVIEDVRPDHGARVLKRYFAGELPFKAVKSREDFPDGFIFEVLADLAAEGDILVVTGDARLTAALTMVPAVTVFPTVKELIESDEFDDLRSDVESENVARIAEALRQDAAMFQSVLEEGVVDRLAGKFVSYRDPYADEKEGPEQLYIQIVGPVTEWKVGHDADYLGEGVISFDFTATVEINVDISTGDEFYDDLYGSSTERTVEIEGALSLQMDAGELRQPSSDWSGAKLLAIAGLHVDEIFSIELVEEEY